MISCAAEKAVLNMIKNKHEQVDVQYYQLLPLDSTFLFDIPIRTV
jgi:hypothetical protein